MSVDVNLVVGFLGSGKTTLIKKLVSRLNKKVAIIENEFGEVNIDEEILNDENLVFDMSSGCLCCSMRGDIIVNLKDISDKAKEVEHIFIEATGVAEPGPIIETILGSEYFNKNFILKSVINVFDESSFLTCLENNDQNGISLMASQIAMANYCYLTKSVGREQTLHFIKEQNPLIEIVTDEKVIEIEKEYLSQGIDMLNRLEGAYGFNEMIVFDPSKPFAFKALSNGRFCYTFAAKEMENNIKEAVSLFASKMAMYSNGNECELDILYSLGQGGEIPHPEFEEGDNLCLIHNFSKFECLEASIIERKYFNSSVRFQSGLSSRSFELNGKMSLEKFQMFINYILFQYGPRLYRSKGLINLDDGRTILFQGVFSTFTFEEISGKTNVSNKIVFIGKDLNGDALHAGLLNCMA